MRRAQASSAAAVLALDATTLATLAKRACLDHRQTPRRGSTTTARLRRWSVRMATCTSGVLSQPAFAPLHRWLLHFNAALTQTKTPVRLVGTTHRRWCLPRWCPLTPAVELSLAIKIQQLQASGRRWRESRRDSGPQSNAGGQDLGNPVMKEVLTQIGPARSSQSGRCHFGASMSRRSIHSRARC